MNRKLFQTIVTALYWVCNLTIALLLAFVLFGIFLQLSGKKNGFYVNDMPFDNMNKTIFKIPILVDLQESLMDTTILFRSKESRIREPEMYQVKKTLDSDDTYYSELFEKNNNSILNRYRAGSIFPTDTLTSALLVYSKKNPSSFPIHLDNSKPKQLKGFIQLKISNMTNGWLVVACNWLEIITKVTLSLLIWVNLLLQDVRKYRIFTIDNFRRLRWIGVGLLVMV